MIPSRSRALHQGFTLLELVICLAVILLLLAFLLPSTTRSREPARRTQCKNNLKQIGLAMHNYHDKYGCFPPAFTVDADGKPLHSWRTLLLPFLDQVALYDTIDFSKPWDDPANAAAAQTPMPVYACPSSIAGPGQTSYFAIVTADSILRPKESRSIQQTTDGTSNTLLIIEVPYDRSVPWMSPQDADAAFLASLYTPKPKYSHVGGFHSLLADGSVRFLSEKMEPATFSALTTAAGGEKIGEF